jgi:TonB family protein
MAPEWIYLLKANVGIALFYAFYKLFCQRDTFFQWRRFALLSFLGISFIYPLLNIQDWVKEQPAMYELADYYANWMATEEITATTPMVIDAPQLPSLLTIGIYLYYIGVIVMSFRFIVQLFSVLRMRWKGTRSIVDGQRIISIPTEADPFSFFGWIFLYLPGLKDESREEILKHEQTHARQWHSMDVILCELINIVCWFNPFAWLIKTEIRLNLEYLADNKVAETTSDCKLYQYHLLHLVNKNVQTGLCNNFNVSHLKHRIIMMNKKRTHTAGRIKYALFVPLAAALLIASNISCISSEKQEEISEKQESRAAEGEVFQVVEEMPEFPGGMGECMKWLGQNIKYPADAKEKGVQGRVIVQFVVEKDGTIVNAKVVRGVDPDLDAEALRVVNQSPKWKPGKQKGEAVRVKYTLPIMFRLGNDSSDSKAAEAPREAKVDENGVHQVCEEMPEFPGGMAECMKYLSKNINYPEDCKKEGIQGRVIVQFVVDKDGSIKDPTIARGVHPSLDKEALRVLSSMPNWKPGKQKGEAVKVRYTIPVMFKLQ